MTIRASARSLTPLRFRLGVADHPNLYFWCLFLTLNGLLFLPTYLLNSQTSTFLPILSGAAEDPTRLVRQLFLWRNNLDIFRLSAELTMLLALWVLLPWSRAPRLRRLMRRLLAFTYVLALAYALYESLTIFLYQVDAVFYAHARMLVDGLAFLLQHLGVQLWLVVALVLAFACGAIVVLSLVRFIAGGIPVERLSIWSKILLAMLALFSISAVFQQRSSLASPKSVVSSLSFKLYKNAADSMSMVKRVRSMDGVAYDQLYDYSGYDLLAKPDIYFIFIESYGSVLYKKAVFRDAYAELLGDLSDQLQEDGWYATSALSESTTWGGGSWMAYTSALFGLRVDNHPQYVALLERFQEEDYPDLGHYLHAQGYEYIRATSLAAELPDEEWQEYVNFFGVDRWIRYSDLAYRGKHYGWGPSPPDQYVLNALHEDIKGQSDHPFLLFWITQNSHYPWRKVPQVVDDWRAMNDGNAVVAVFEDEAMSLSTKQDNYFEAITYELSFLTDFILKEADDDAVFILIGDHQPGWITRRADGFESPLHIISKDKAFLEQFAEYGFESGLKVENPAAAIRHEGFYSLFMRAFLKQYGHGNGKLPPYLPDGIQLQVD